MRASLAIISALRQEIYLSAVKTNNSYFDVNQRRGVMLFLVAPGWSATRKLDEDSQIPNCP
jgi:hypothetical protein